MTEIDVGWAIIDPWWNEYVQEQESDLIKLRELLQKLNHMWAQSESDFDDDPLVGN